MKMALGNRIAGRLIARLKLKAVQMCLDRRHDRAPLRIMTTYANRFDAIRESRKSQESITRSRSNPSKIGAHSIEMDFKDLCIQLEQGFSIEEIARFLCRTGTVDEVRRKAEELGL